MKTVIIPSDYHPFVIEVNGIKYTYPEGTEQSVPDEVASAIHNYYKLQPREGDPNPVPFGVDADGKEEYKSKYTGAEIDAAVAKADTVPAVTVEDAGSALVVDEEGKIVAGEVGTAPGYYTITAAELASVAVSFGTAVAAATDKLQVYNFEIPNTDPGYESINATIENICAHPGFNYISVTGSDNMLVYTTDEHTIKTGPVSYSGAELHFWLRGTVNNEITIEMTTQKINMA